MTKSNFKFYQPDDVYGTLFFQFPKVLIYGDKYNKLSSDAKIAYMLLKDKLEFSIKNEWIDEDNYIYFKYSNIALMQIFNYSEKTVIKIKKELESVDLLYQKRMGYNPKTKKNEANRLYLGELELSAEDVYKKEKRARDLATSGTVKSTVRSDTPQTLATSGTVKSTVRSNTPQTLATSGTVKSTAYLYKDILDTSLDNIKDTQELDFSSSNFSEAQLKVQNQDLVKNSKSFLKEGTHELFLSDEAINLLQMWCNSPQQLRKMVGIILNAKNAVCKENEELGVFFVLEEEALQEKILNTLRRYFNAIRTKENKITNYENYLFGSMKNMFAEYWNNQALKQRLNSNETNKENLNMDDSVWSNSNYENETSQNDLARLERIKLEALAKINSKAT
ncbi:replication initiator protein A (plasmid) [Lactococcus lactis]|uniref:replication initiator protein A n=2 Tax=Lactococcus TaxID=1357 RepID=UPI000F549134|nr:replication initiator protein A [Lactococcus lactis]MDM7503188.1 replication initiator protein A [Lactococcus lactis]RQE05922.1 plasmid replication initiation protein [Lactococcus lactis]RQE16552.1 plasmid replication initiation protein [Lactococcus lactis]RQE30808.1 plasmid replication initiation protein [Lactococcus lactis]